MTAKPDLVALAESLRAILPSEALSFDVADEYAIDGLKPMVVARPRTHQELSAVLRASTAAAAAVAPRGAGTQTSLGMPPERYDVALELTGLDRLLEHESADLTVTVDAGHSWAAMQAALAEHGQWVPLDPALAEDATVGGILATNASGPARIRYGTARDLVIGMTVALASGEIVKSGGRVVKNVAGYDMAKLHIGALGTLGVILQASFKVSPLAESRPSIGASGALTAVSKLAGDVMAARLPLLGLLLTRLGEARPWHLQARFGGGASAVERAMAEFRGLATVAGLTLTPVEPANGLPGGATVVLRAAVPPRQTVALSEAMVEAGAWLWAYPGVGSLHGSWEQAPTPEALTALRRRAVAAGGALVVERAPLELKRAVGVWGEPRSDFALMRRLKQQFDPSRTLNPGRFVGGI